MSNQDKYTYHKPIPPGWETFTLTFKLSGSNHRLDNVQVALDASNTDPNVILMPEPDNEHDRNAVMVMVKKRMFIFETKFNIGYLPRDLAKILHKFDVCELIDVRIKEMHIYKSQKVAIICDIIGPKALYSNALKKALDKCEM